MRAIRPEVSTPSAEFQIVRPKQPADTLQVRFEYDPKLVSDVAGITRRLTQQFRERLGVATRFDLVPRGELPRFSCMAARVVDE